MLARGEEPTACRRQVTAPRMTEHRILVQSAIPFPSAYLKEMEAGTQ